MVNVLQHRSINSVSISQDLSENSTEILHPYAAGQAETKAKRNTLPRITTTSMHASHISHAKVLHSHTAIEGHLLSPCGWTLSRIYTTKAVSTARDILCASPLLTA